MLILLFEVSFEKRVNAAKLCLKSFKCFEALFVVIPHRFTTVLISQHNTCHFHITGIKE